MFFIVSHLQTHYHLKLNFQKVDQHTGGKYLIHGTKRRKDNQLQSLELPWKYPSMECKHGIKESEGSMFNPMFRELTPRDTAIPP